MNKKKIILTFLLITCCLLLGNGCSRDNSPIRTGDKIASFSAIDLNGKTFSLASRKGNPVIIRFFLVNCPFCKADTPIINNFYEKYRQKGLEIVYINNNAADAEEVRRFTEDLGVQFPVIFDPDRRIAGQFNIKIQPVALILSPEHKLLAALLGGIGEPELAELLDPYLRK